MGRRNKYRKYFYSSFVEEKAKVSWLVRRVRREGESLQYYRSSAEDSKGNEKWEVLIKGGDIMVKH